MNQGVGNTEDNVMVNTYEKKFYLSDNGDYIIAEVATDKEGTIKVVKLDGWKEVSVFIGEELNSDIIITYDVP